MTIFFTGVFFDYHYRRLCIPRGSDRHPKTLEETFRTPKADVGRISSNHANASFLFFIEVQTRKARWKQCSCFKSKYVADCFPLFRPIIDQGMLIDGEEEETAASGANPGRCGRPSHFRSLPVALRSQISNARSSLPSSQTYHPQKIKQHQPQWTTLRSIPSPIPDSRDVCLLEQANLSHCPRKVYITSDVFHLAKSRRSFPWVWPAVSAFRVRTSTVC